jgi:MoaA/NifB/PqqE/SkfB family radical SAM enzyme
MHSLIAPKAVRLEASSRCQLRCPSCPTTAKAIDPVVGSNVLKFDDFRRFLEANPRVRDIEISNYGEVFLNPELLEILRCAHQHGVTINIANGANFNHVSPQVLEALVKYGVARITCSIDGASQETYAQYRVRGNFDRVMENLRLLNRFKAEHQSERPELTWQFIVFGHNEHEISRAREMAREMNMKLRFKLNWDADFSPMRNVEQVLAETGLPAPSREAYAEKFGVDYKADLCRQLWLQPQINWDGKNLGCGRNFWGDFGGNAFRDGLLSMVNGKKMQHARDMLLGRAQPRGDIPCTTCSVYQQMRATGHYMESPVPPVPLLKMTRRRLGLVASDRFNRLRARVLDGLRPRPAKAA